MCNPHTKFETSTFTFYKDMDGNANCRNCAGLGWLEVTQGHRQCPIRWRTYDFLFDFNRNYASIFYRFRVI